MGISGNITSGIYLDELLKQRDIFTNPSGETKMKLSVIEEDGTKKSIPIPIRKEESVGGGWFNKGDDLPNYKKYTSPKVLSGYYLPPSKYTKASSYSAPPLKGTLKAKLKESLDLNDVFNPDDYKAIYLEITKNTSTSGTM